MNKKILMSIAASATVAGLFTGCGTDSVSSSSLSGIASKAELSGATATFGGATATTTSTGAFTVSGTASSTEVTVTGGTYTLNNVDKNNTVTLKATKAQINAGAPASILTTLISEFGDTETAYNALGLVYDADTVDVSTVDAGDFESAAVVIAMLMEKATNLGTVMSSLKSSASSRLTLTTLATAINTAGTADGLSADDLAIVNAVATNVRDGRPLGYALSVVNEGNATLAYNEADYKSTNVIDTNATDTDTSDDVVSFSLMNYDANLTNANGNTSLFVSIKGSDASNVNTSYVMGLTNLDIMASGSTLTLNNANTSAVLNTMANSNISYAISMDTNASALDSAGLFTGNDVNVTAFSDYAEALYADSNDSTVGTFVMPNGNYSVKVYVNIDDQKMTKNAQLTDIVSSSMKQTSNNGTVLFSGVQAYKVIDANLTK